MYRKVTIKLNGQEMEMFVKCTDKARISDIVRKAKRQLVKEIEVEVE